MIGWLMLAAASAAPADVSPDWLKKPSRADMMQVWPEEALKRGKSGKAVIHCDVTIHGALVGCKILSEEPAGIGFGSAALALTPQFLMKPAVKNGKPVRGAATIPIQFVAGSPVSADKRIKVVSNVVWSRAPTYAELVAAFPDKARAKGVGGAVTLACEFNGAGGLRECDTVNESPWGMGFAGAAHSLVGKFIGPTRFHSGESTKDARTQLRFTFPVEMLSSSTPSIGKPAWAATPTADELKGAIPQQAIAAGVTTARVALDCTVVAEGRLEACRVLSEEPKGLGFAETTLNLSKSFRLTIWTADGLPSVGGKVRIPVRYDVPPPSVAP